MTETKPVYCDVTELVGFPTRTGIQRVVREVLKHWSGPRDLILCRFDGAQLVELPTECSYYLLEPDRVTRSEPVGALQAKLGALIAERSGAAVPLDATVFIPELFFNEQRCKHYLWRIRQFPDRIHMLIYDFIPWIYPDIIGVQRSEALMWYIRLVQKVRRAAFISGATFEDWKTRIVRDDEREGAVLPLGSDALILERQSFSPDKRNYVSLGSIDGRKNQREIIKAFAFLWADDVDVSLTLVGGIFDSQSEMIQELEALANNPRFRHVNRATDDEVAAILATARATIYASTTEGYGLPPVESLAVGIPCIVGRHIPSMERVDAGIKALTEVSAEQIAAAVLSLTNDEEAARLWAEAALLNLPTWADFGRSTAEWIGDH